MYRLTILYSLYIIIKTAITGRYPKSERIATIIVAIIVTLAEAVTIIGILVKGRPLRRYVIILIFSILSIIVINFLNFIAKNIASARGK